MSPEDDRYKGKKKKKKKMKWLSTISCPTLYYTTLLFYTLYYTALYCTIQHYSTLHCTILYNIYSTLHYTALNCTTLPSRTLPTFLPFTAEIPPRYHSAFVLDDASTVKGTGGSFGYPATLFKVTICTFNLKDTECVR